MGRSRASVEAARRIGATGPEPNLRALGRAHITPHGSNAPMAAAAIARAQPSSLWQKLRGDRVLHSGHACVGIALCTSPETRTRTTQRLMTRPPRGLTLRDS